MQIKVNRQIAAVIIVYPNSLPFLKFANLNKGNAAIPTRSENRKVKPYSCKLLEN